MNSFSTSGDTLAFLKAKYPGLAAEEGLEMMQNKVPKLDATTFEVRARVKKTSSNPSWYSLLAKPHACA
jgi:hypothetical protein